MGPLTSTRSPGPFELFDSPFHVPVVEHFQPAEQGTRLTQVGIELQGPAEVPLGFGHDILERRLPEEAQ